MSGSKAMAISLAPKPALDVAALTQGQLRVYGFVVEYLGINGYPPSLREISDHLGLRATFGVRKHIDQLIEKGFLSRVGVNTHRSLRVTQLPHIP